MWLLPGMLVHIALIAIVFAGGMVAALLQRLARQRVERAPFPSRMANTWPAAVHEPAAADESASGGSAVPETPGQLDLLAGLRHEVRTPLTSLVTYTDLLLASDLPRSQREQVEVVASSGRMIADLIDETVELTQLEPGTVENAAEPAEIGALLQQVASMLAPLASAKGLALGVWIDDEVPHLLELDCLRTRQMVCNLLDNAIKFTEAGGIDLEARVEHATDGRHLLITVIDTGIGIAAERQDAILRPFAHADAPFAGRYAGTGRGLALTSRMAGAMGGRLVIHSKRGIGSSVTLRLPLREYAGRPEAACGDGRTALPRQLLGPARVLVTEHDDLSQHLMLALSDRLGIAAELAASGEETVAAVDAAARNGEPFDAVLMNIDLPGMDGLETTRILRARGHDSRTLPIIALTASTQPEAVRRAREAGMQAYVVKPVTSVALARELARFLAAPGEAAREPANDDRARVQHNGTLRACYRNRKDKIFDCLRRSLERDPASTDWEALADNLHRLAGVAADFGEAELGEMSRRLERRIKLTAEPSRCQAALRQAWPNLERAA